MFLQFDVFGKKMVIQRLNGEWLLFSLSSSGIRSRVYDVAIPSDLSKDDLALYLDDIFHESASTEKCKVNKLE